MRAVGWALGRLALGGVAVAITLSCVFLASERLVDPVRARLGADAPAEEVAAVRARLGLDDPLPIQAVRQVRRLVSGDFGESTLLGRPAGAVVGGALGSTARLAGLALPVALVCGLPLGAAVAALERRVRRRFAWPALLATQGLPDFVAAVLAVQVVAVSWGWFPPSGSPALPMAVGVLGLLSGAELALLLSDRLHELGREPWALAALARGASQLGLLRGHLLRPAAVQVTSWSTLELGHLLGGALVVEAVFGLPGIGRIAIVAAETRDVPVLMAAASVSAAAYLLVRFAGDLGLAALDPRVRDGIGR